MKLSLSEAKQKVIIGKESFKDADDFLDALGCALESFLENITDYPQYVYPATGEHPTMEYEENIQFYYTNKGDALVSRWMARMEKVFDKYFPEDVWREPTCCYYKQF